MMFRTQAILAPIYIKQPQKPLPKVAFVKMKCMAQAKSKAPSLIVVVKFFLINLDV